MCAQVSVKQSPEEIAPRTVFDYSLPAFCKTGVHRFFYGIDDVVVTGAAAHIPCEFFTQFVARVPLARAEQVFCRHDKAGRAETALYGCFIDKCLLDVGDGAVDIDESLDRQHIFSVSPNGQEDTGRKDFTVDEYGAGAAFSDFTSFFTDVSPKSLRNMSESDSRMSTDVVTCFPLRVKVIVLNCFSIMTRFLLRG